MSQRFADNVQQVLAWAAALGAVVFAFTNSLSGRQRMLNDAQDQMTAAYQGVVTMFSERDEQRAKENEELRESVEGLREQVGRALDFIYQFSCNNAPSCTNRACPNRSVFIELERMLERE